ncbi:MAG: metal-binding protein [Prochlorotrichaceae cyanobacterium]
MPAGRIHDRITLWGLPLCGGLTLMTSGSSRTTLIICSGYLLGGLLLGPDLDIHSRPYKRWGWLRWLWLPYQKSVRHRSFWSHGFLVGTTLRLLYLGLCILAIGAVLLLLWSGAIAGGQWWQVFQDASQVLLSHSIGFLQQHSREGLFLFLGLEIGAMSHSVADRLLSAWKRSRRRRKSSRKS